MSGRDPVDEVGASLDRIARGSSTEDDEHSWADAVAADGPLGRNGTRPRAPTADSAERGRSWAPVDLSGVLSGSRPAPSPTILTRTDGIALCYARKTHAIIAESEGGKTWFALLGCAQQIGQGRAAVLLDFEDNPDLAVERLRALRVPDDRIRDRFAYIAPDEPLDPHGWTQLTQALGDLHPALVVLDGITEALALHGLKSVDNDDQASFGRTLTRPLAATGAAVISLDHPPKDTANRGRYALGAVHKLNGLTGVSLIAENVRPLGVGLRGITRLRIAKDRPGRLRAHGLPAADGMTWIGDFILDTSATGDPAEPAYVSPPADAQRAAAAARPTTVMHAVLDAITRAGTPLTQRGILDRVTGRDDTVRTAIAALLDDGHLTTSPGPRGATLHNIARPLDDREDDQ